MFRTFILDLAGAIPDRAAERAMHAECSRSRADAIYPEREVQQRSEQRKKPDEPEPERGGARITFVQQGMNGGEEGGQKVRARSEVRPEQRKFVEPVQFALVVPPFPISAQIGRSRQGDNMALPSN